MYTKQVVKSACKVRMISQLMIQLVIIQTERSYVCTDGTLVMRGTLILCTELYDCPLQRTISAEKKITSLLDIRGNVYGMRVFSGVQ